MEKNHYQFQILPATLAPFASFKEAHNLAYAHYKNSWERILNRPGREALFNPDEFLRQNYIFQIVKLGEVVVQILGTHYNLDHLLTQDLSYFQNFKNEAQEMLKRENKKYLMSLEYSSVNRNFSPKHVDGLNFGEIITHLGTEFAKSLGVEVIMGQPRRVTGTNDRVIGSGFRCVKAQVTKCNVTVDLTLGFIDELPKHPEERVKNLIEYFWNSRMDYTGFSTNEPNKYSSYFKTKSANLIKESISITEDL